jgi:ribosome maturation protein SDO1
MQKIVIVKLRKGGEEFEILVDADMAYEYATGKRSDPLSVLQTEEVFKDARKNERQSTEKIKKVFGTTDVAKVADAILKEGDVPMTAEQRNMRTEEKRKQIIDIIAKNSIDPRTNAPNPPMRIENAMKECKVNIDPFKGASEQVDEVVKKISVVMPIKFTTIRMTVTVPAAFANRSYGTLKRFGMKSERWLPDGSLQASIEFPAGMQSDFLERINNAAEGQADVQIEK